MATYDVADKYQQQKFVDRGRRRVIFCLKMKGLLRCNTDFKNKQLTSKLFNFNLFYFIMKVVYNNWHP